jgi:hypothetical protein
MPGLLCLPLNCKFQQLGYRIGLKYHNINMVPCTHNHKYFSLTNMESLLRIAARVEAAVASYISVRDTANDSEWRHSFEGERVSFSIQFGVISVLFHPYSN